MYVHLCAWCVCAYAYDVCAAIAMCMRGICICVHMVYLYAGVCECGIQNSIDMYVDNNKRHQFNE